MKKYENLDNFREREHIIEVTLQSGIYKGTLKQKVGGNCFGLSILHSFDPDCICEDDTFYENNCGFKMVEDDDGEYWFTCVLKDDEGNECEVEEEMKYLESLIVKLEIVDCKIV